MPGRSRPRQRPRRENGLNLASNGGPGSWVLTLLLGLVLGLVLTPLARMVATRIGDIDRPVGMKIHERPTPLMGGLAVYLAFAGALALSLPMSAPVRGLLIGGGAAVLLGVVDELLTLPPLVHLAGQIGAAVVGVVAGVGVVRTLSVPVGALTTPGYQLPVLIGAALTIVWIVGMMNTVNFLDGLDGLAAGIAGIAALLLAVWAAEPSRFALPLAAHHQDALLPLALLGALLGFLPYNWNPASIFLGDSGAMFLGFAIAALSIVGPAKLGTATLILLVPILDVAWAIVRRRLRGRSFLSGDKQHVYHRMIQLGMSRTATVLSLYALCAGLAVLDLNFLKLAKLVAFVAFALLVGGAFILLEVLASRRDASRRPEEPAPRVSS